MYVSASSPWGDGSKRATIGWESDGVDHISVACQALSSQSQNLHSLAEVIRVQSTQSPEHISLEVKMLPFTCHVQLLNHFRNCQNNDSSSTSEIDNFCNHLQGAQTLVKRMHVWYLVDHCTSCLGQLVAARSRGPNHSQHPRRTHPCFPPAA